MLNTSSFALTNDELLAINRYIQTRAEIHAASGEDPASGVTVEFTFTPSLGRLVTVRFDGELTGMDIESV